MSRQTVEKPLVNRVAQSSILTLQLEEYFPAESIVGFDFHEHLFRGMILREKDFREVHKSYDWQGLEGKILAVYCSSEAIIPMWAYMLVGSAAAPFAEAVMGGTVEAVANRILLSNLEKIEVSKFAGQRVVVKGCSDKEVSSDAYLKIAQLLQPVVQSLMFGEPCSTVPVFKRPRQIAK